MRGKALVSIEAAFERAHAGGGGNTTTLRSSAKRQRTPNDPIPMEIDDDEDPELAAAIAASLGQSQSTVKPGDQAGPSSAGALGGCGGGGGGTGGGGGAKNLGGSMGLIVEADEEDADLMRAIAMSLKQGQEAAAGGGGIGAGGHDEAGPSSASALPPLPALTRDHSGEGNSSAAADVDSDEMEEMMNAPHAEGEAASALANLGHPRGFEDDEDADLAAAIAASLADQSEAPASTSQGLWGAGPSSSSQAIDDTLDEEPEQGPGVISLVFNVPSIGRVQRLFLASKDKPSMVYKFLRATLRAKGQPLASRSLTISRSYPRQDLDEMDQRSLSEIGIERNEALVFIQK